MARTRGNVARDNEDRRFGELPLPQTVAAAAAIRRLTSVLLALEHPHPTVDDMLVQFADWERELGEAIPPDSAPRMRTDDETKRIYLAHAFDIGAFNPCFPEYSFDHLDAETASGTVTFPLVFEGPPGYVHGGFLGVFFDCVTQHQNCAEALSGRTRTLTVTYRRPTPVLTEVRFDIVRTEVDRAITSTARLLDGEEVLCVGEMKAVAMPPEKLSVALFATRGDSA
jgi:hypothetical protein